MFVWKVAAIALAAVAGSGVTIGIGLLRTNLEEALGHFFGSALLFILSYFVMQAPGITRSRAAPSAPTLKEPVQDRV
ncbi:hypothetical protein CDN99_01645 [Roseateles aquatilis]|uniref:Uncharacterized protein n=1 Tax=Roseateles aquatilis TaxID=431061 RepID=A0A246JKT7_9BURK|nr:hypothetical protein [Roseateles aquatilis]OWQ93222.1 hypothetical protein CDN99_01645 [Roseateles aquatilis]